MHAVHVIAGTQVQWQSCVGLPCRCDRLLYRQAKQGPPQKQVHQRAHDNRAHSAGLWSVAWLPAALQSGASWQLQNRRIVSKGALRPTVAGQSQLQCYMLGVAAGSALPQWAGQLRDSPAPTAGVHVYLPPL